MRNKLGKKAILAIIILCLSCITSACRHQSDYDNTNNEDEVSPPISPIEIDEEENTSIVTELPDDIGQQTLSEYNKQDNSKDIVEQKPNMPTEVRLEHQYITLGGYIKCITLYDSSKHIEYEPSTDDLENRIYSGEIVELDYETELNLDKDKTREIIKLTWNQEGDLYKYKLEVGTCVIEHELFVTYEGFRIRGALINNRFGSDIYILVGYPANDIMYYEDIYIYDYESYSGEERLQYIGTTSEIYRLAPYGFTIYEMGRLLQTWSYEMDYTIGNGYILNNEGNSEYFEFIYPLSKNNYPMGTICKLEQDIVLYKRKGDEESRVIIPEGKYVGLCECDDEQWLYIRDLETSEGGWLEFDLNGNCIQGDKTFEGHEIFDGLKKAG